MGRKFDPAIKDSLLSEERAQRFDRYEFLRSIGVDKGKTVADLGCGPGFFTLPLAELVGPTGQVYAVDVALLGFVLLEIDQRSQVRLAAKRLLKPGGKIAVLEWYPIETPVGPPLDAKILADEVIADADAAGLKLVDQRSPHEWHYLLLFEPR